MRFKTLGMSRSCKCDGSAALGFSLIELMICLSVIGILLMTALPAFQKQTLKSRRSVGVAAMLMVLARQEHYFVMNKHYAPELQFLGYSTSTIAIGPDGEILSATSPRRIYALSIQDALPKERPQQFVLRATPELAQGRDMECGELEISSKGVKSARLGGVDNCW